MLEYRPTEYGLLRIVLLLAVVGVTDMRLIAVQMIGSFGLPSVSPAD